MKIFIFLAMLFFSFSSANELSLDEEISLMKTAPSDKRYELMNNIKKRIASMNGAKRAEAISKFAHGSKKGTNANMNQDRKNINSMIHDVTLNPHGVPKKQTIGNSQQRVPKQINKK